MATELVSARLSKESTAVLKEFAFDEKTDKTTALRKMLELGGKQYKKEKALRLYQQGKVSVGTAAQMAGLSLWELLDELKLRGITNQLDVDDYKEAAKNLAKVWK